MERHTERVKSVRKNNKCTQVCVCVSAYTWLHISASLIEAFHRGLSLTCNWHLLGPEHSATLTE